MTEIETMLEEGVMPDFERLYETGELVPVGKSDLSLDPITPETPKFEHLTQEQVVEILEIEGS